MKKLVSMLVAVAASVGEMINAAIFNYLSRWGLVLYSVSLPNGALVHIASGYGSSKAVSAITNANPGVATLEAAHGVATGDLIEVTSGWSRLTDRIVRAGTVSVNDVPLAGIDTTLTTIFPSGSGVGTVREISGWTQLAQILNSSSNGGEQQFLEYQFLEADAKKRIPTFKNPWGLTFTIADDPSLAGYQLAAVANADRLPRAVRITLPSGSLLYYNAYISLNTTPTLTVNELMACEATLSLLGEPVRYAS